MSSKLNSQHQESSLFDAVTELMMTLDLNLRIQWTNQKASQLVNEDPENLEGRHCFQIWHGRGSPCENCPALMTKQTGEPQESEIKTPDGRYWHLRSYPLRSQEGDLESIAEIALDITQSKKAEEQNRFLSAIVENSYDSVIVTDSSFQITYINKETEELFGYKIDEIQGNNPTILHAESNTQEAFRKIYEVVASGETYIDEALRKRKDGSTFVCDLRVMPLLNDDGTAYSYVGIHRDITERKRAEAALQESEKKFRNIFNNSSEAIFIHDTNGRFLEVNDVACERLGYMREELLGMTPMDINTLESEQIISERIRSLHQEGQICFETTHARKDGHRIPVEVTSRLIDYQGETCILSTARDISERRQTEEELQRYRYLLEKSQEIAHVGSWELDVSSGRLTWSDETYRIFGLEPREAEMTERTFLDFVHPEDRDAVYSAYNESMRMNRDTFEIEHRIIRKRDENIRTLFNKCYHLRDDSGSIVKSIGMIQDITEQRQKERDIREREEELQTIFNTMESGIFLVDKEGYIIQTNKAMTEMLQYDFEDVIGSRYIDHVYETETEAASTKMRQLMDGELNIVHLERLYQRSNGATFWGSLSGRRLYYPDGTFWGLVGVITDITELKQVEKALRESEERFKTILENLPGGIFAHDLDGRILMVNAQAGKNTGYSREELLGMTVWDIDPYAASRDDQAALWQSLEIGESTTIESIHTMKDGTQYPAEIHLNAIKLDQQPIILPIAFDISWRKHFEQALKESEQQFRTLFMESPVSITIHDKDDGEILDANPKAYTSYGLSSLEELKAKGMFMEPPYSYAEALGWIRKAAAEGPQQFEWLNRDIYGELFWEQVRLIPMTINGVQRVVATTIDITELKETMDALHRSENYYRAMFETSGSAMFIIEDDTTISLVNSNFEELSGYTSQEMEGRKSWTDFAPPEDVEWMKENHYLRRQDPDAAPRQYDIRFITRHEEQRNVLLAVDMIPGTSRSIVSCIDITQRKQMEEKLKEMSFRDSLTGLYNRNFFEEEMVRLGSGRYNPVGIVVCDLDGLKFVNDTLGHQAGDRMLIQTADILRHNFRSSDIIARIGGDEFAVQLPETEPEVVEQILRRLRQAVHDHSNAEPELPLSLSMGYALDERGTADMQALFREADNRMYREKIQREGSARSAILQALTGSMEARDFNTENHCDRMQELAASLARSLSLSQDVINDLYLLARFHDLGKVGIPDHILFKPGPLTEEEWRQMRQHCEIGHRIASSVPDLEPIADWIIKHHECWDGQGYPLGLAGQDIPLPCRILAIADAYDAMTSDRPYRKAMTREEAVAELRRCAGSQFDPELVERFIRIIQELDKG